MVRILEVFDKKQIKDLPSWLTSIDRYTIPEDLGRNVLITQQRELRVNDVVEKNITVLKDFIALIGNGEHYMVFTGEAENGILPQVIEEVKSMKMNEPKLHIILFRKPVPVDELRGTVAMNLETLVQGQFEKQGLRPSVAYMLPPAERFAIVFYNHAGTVNVCMNPLP